MGFIVARVRIHNPVDPSRVKEIELLVDTGARHALVPRSLLEELGIKAMDTGTFVTADGRKIQGDVGGVLMEVMGRRRYVSVIFGEENDTPVLGVTALENLDLELNPSTGDLRPSSQMFLV